MHAYRPITSCVTFLAAFFTLAAVLAQNSVEPAVPQENERQLIGILQSDGPASEKAIACKRLAIFGGREAVPALAALLSDERLTSWARIALEAIPGPEADKALRGAAAKLKGRPLVGVINTIGVRRDANAVKMLIQHLNNQDVQVASAAALALGRVGDAEATQVLRQSLTQTTGPVRSAVAEGCLLSAEHLLAKGKAHEAAGLYDQVRQVELPKQRLLEATRGLILARGAAGIPLLVEQLRSDDKAFFQIGLSTARELSGRDATNAIAAELGLATPEHAVLLLLALADRADRTVMPTVLQAAKNGPQAVRIAAIGVMQHLGDESSLPQLLDMALESDKELSKAAKTALAQLPGKDVDKALTAHLLNAEEARLPLLIELVGLRQMTATAPLIKAADHPSADVRHAALLALGATVGPDQLMTLISRVTDPRDPEDGPTAQRALRNAAIRMPDRDACAKQLVAAMPDASVPTQCGLLDTLAAMGGETALHAMGTAAKTSEPKLQETASRLLGEWMSIDAGPLLLELARDSDHQYKIRALRGYIRLARQFPMPDAQRVAMCGKALEIASRPAEKRLVLAVMARYPSINMLKLAVHATRDSDIKDGATQVALGIAQKLEGKTVDTRQLLAQIGQEPVEVEIIEAEYGAGSTQKDVTEILRAHAHDMRLIVLPSTSFNTVFGGDPIPGTEKQLTIRYKINGNVGVASFAEDSAIMLPVPE